MRKLFFREKFAPDRSRMKVATAVAMEFVGMANSMNVWLLLSEYFFHSVVWFVGTYLFSNRKTAFEPKGVRSGGVDKFMF